jgi:outer membrane protein OmpA-like peptidoglycan-associated protein
MGVLAMGDFSTNEIPKELSEVVNGNGKNHQEDFTAKNAQVGEDLNELRSLLLGVEPGKLTQLYERLENPKIQPSDISHMLPEAVILRSKRDGHLGEAMVTTVEEAIQASVKQDQDILSEAIFPIMGPAIRKSVSTTFGEMIQSLNQTLEHSFSPQSLKWRLEAQSSGKSFAEIIMLRTLIYQVEQVFLIHKKTGLLLQHIVAPQIAGQDPDLVSAMLTAIQDFIKDSFSVKKGEVLQSLQFGDLTIWIEEGPQAVLAGIIRGNAPQELRLIFQQAIEKIHLKLGAELIAYEGESEPFAISKTYLQDCLKFRYKTPSKKNYNSAWAFLGTAAIALGIWSFFTIREHLRWSSYLEKLNKQPGIVVIKSEERYGKYFISGMRDPLAVEPNILMEEANINPQEVTSQWKLYLSFEPEFTLQRAEEFLEAPKSVSLRVNENQGLEVTGSAPRKWILAARKSWRFIPGVARFDDTNLVPLELDQLKSYKNQIEEEMLFFLEGRTDFIPGQANNLSNLVNTTQKLLEASKYLKKQVRIEIVGHTNTVGSEQRNMLLSQARASKILNYLQSQGVNTRNFSSVGVGTTKPLREEITEKDQQANRRVSFKVFLND